MKSIIILLALAAVSELGHGEEYVINAERVRQRFQPSNKIMQIDGDVTPQQNIEFRRDINQQDPLLIDGLVQNEASGFEYLEEPFASCNSIADGTWDYVMSSLIEKGIFPEGQCPVMRGKYTIEPNVDPITVNFPGQIDCGNYSAIIDLNSKYQWFASVQFDFTIEDDGNCIS